MLFAVYRSPFAVGTRSSPLVVRPFHRANSLDKSRQHLFYVRRGTLQHLSLFWGEKPQILRQQNKTNQFIGRACGYMQELPEFGAGCSSTSLRDIGGDGGRRSSRLTGQAKSFGTGISSRRPIDAQSQSLTKLPDLQFSEVLHELTPFSVGPECVTLAQEFNTKQVLSFRICLTANGKRRTASASGELLC